MHALTLNKAFAAIRQFTVPQLLATVRGLFCFGLMLVSTTALAQESVANQLPNQLFRGTNGFIEDSVGTVTGVAPTLWRAFAITGGDITTEIITVGENVIFPGSPATNALRMTVNSHGVDQGFDNFGVRFSLVPGRVYSASIYLLTENTGGDPQEVSFGVPIFDAAGDFVSAPGSSLVSATGEWTKFTGPEFTDNGNNFAEIGFRLSDDGGDDTIVIALPEVEGPPMKNLIPNSGFEGSGGTVVGEVTGPAPDQWRGFAVGGNTINLATVPVAAGELYPGSPATNAVKLTVDTFAGGDAGLDHEGSLFPLFPSGRSQWGEVYLRSANADNSDQVVSVAIPLFKGNLEFVSQPGSFFATVGPTWGYFGGFSFSDTNATFGQIAFRLIQSGANNAILIAMPLVNGFDDSVFVDGFETDLPNP